MTANMRIQHALTDTEQDVLYWISNGLSNSQVGKQLYLSEDTVKTHCRRIFIKREARDRAHAVRKGFEIGVLRGGIASPRRDIDPAKAVVQALVALGWQAPRRVVTPGRAS